jgi:hypothetical protein
MTIPNPILSAVLPLALLLSTGSAAAQQALVFDTFASTDADRSDTWKLGLGYDFDHADAGHYRGLRIEQARFSPMGQATTTQRRLYYRFADGSDDWSWKAMLGSNGHDWLGNASLVHEQRMRQEFFLEREVVETPMGLARGLHYTYAGAAIDIPVDERNVFTALAGVQAFSGNNQRLHLRGRYIRVLDETHGLSLQLRVRYARDSHPHEFDYFSPRWYLRAVPVLQWRRFRGGWQYRLAAGAGRQGQADGPWRAARLFEAGIESPKDARGWSVAASVAHSDEPSANGGGYRYTQGMLEVSRAF